VYEKEWDSFKAFVIKETGSDDPFLTKFTEDEKATLVALMMMMMIMIMRMKRPGSGERPPLRSRQRCAKCMP
jgi:putative sterol carrier protein